MTPDPWTGIVTTEDMVEAARAAGDLQPAEPGTADQWWPASDPDTPPVNMVVLGVAHHMATGHLCGGGGFGFDCEDCDFSIDDGVVNHGGWVRFKAADDVDMDNSGSISDSAR